MRIMPNQCATMLICVDKVADGNLEGECISLYLPQPQPFCDPLNFVGRMDEFFDSIDYPQAYLTPRTFGGPPRGERKAPVEARQYLEESLFETRRGEVATFAVQVQFRQNSSWQGRMLWEERRLTCKFRSTLEMIRLMVSACLGRQSAAWEEDL